MVENRECRLTHRFLPSKVPVLEATTKSDRDIRMVHWISAICMAAFRYGKMYIAQQKKNWRGEARVIMAL